MLTGNLETVALPDVLRLIASSAQSGLLRVEDASPTGRIFIVDGRVAFATTRNEDDPIDDLLRMEFRADYVGSPDERRIVDLNDLLENNPEAFERFLEQMVVDVMTRLLRVDQGQFRFDVDVRSGREIPNSFEVEDLISQANARSLAWTRIFEVVPSVSAPFRMAPRLDEPEKVIIGRRDWALLAATGDSTTIDEIAHRLKIFEFAAAKKVAELTQRGLFDFIDSEGPPASVASAESLSGVEAFEEITFADEQRELNDEETVDAVVEAVIELQPDEIVLDGGLEAESDPDDQPTGEPAGPTWVPVANSADDDAVPLLEELHRLHAAQGVAPVATPNGDGPVESQEQDEEEDDDFDIAVAGGGDLATRWKNLRRTKRGSRTSDE